MCRLELTSTTSSSHMLCRLTALCAPPHASHSRNTPHNFAAVVAYLCRGFNYHSHAASEIRC